MPKAEIRRETARLRDISPFYNRNTLDRLGANKQRAFQLAMQLVAEGTFLRVLRPSKKQQKEGRIAFFGVVLTDPENPLSAEFKVPFRIANTIGTVRALHGRFVDSNGDSPVAIAVNPDFPGKAVKKEMKVLAGRYRDSVQGRRLRY